LLVTTTASSRTHESDWFQDATGFGQNRWLVTAAGASKQQRWFIAYELREPRRCALLGGSYLEDELDLLWDLAAQQPWYRPGPGVSVDIGRDLGP